MTETQQVVVNSWINHGYEHIGNFVSLSGMGETVGLVKGKHRLHINCLGYDEYVSGMSYKLCCADCSFENIQQPCEACVNYQEVK